MTEKFRSLDGAGLVTELADRIDRAASGRLSVGFDGPAETGTTALADRVALELRSRGRQAIRAGTRWWWRPAALRLEMGHHDVDMLLYGWIDARALTKELLEPLAVGGSGSYLTKLRDPDTDRSVRAVREEAGPHAVLLLDGPLLGASELPLDLLVHVHASHGALLRALPPERAWWIDAFDRYDKEFRPADTADIMIAYDHPRSPAIKLN